MRKHLLTAFGCLSLLTMVQTTTVAQVKGPSSSQTPYLVPTAAGVKFTSIINAGDAAPNGYKMVGLPDGTGAFDNGNGTFTFLVNHEIGNTSGIVRAHGSKGAFVSKWIINKSDLSVVSGSDLMTTLKLWNGSSYVTYNSATPYATGLSRFCSADLPAVSAFYNSATGKGTQERIYMNGEENGIEGRGFAHIVTGINAGTSYELPLLGKFSWENSLANPGTGDKTVVAGTDDATPGQVYFYIGTKTNSGTEIEKAGLTNGALYGPSVSGTLIETSASIPSANTPFTMVNLGNVQNLTGAALQTASNNGGVTQFLRPEDGTWDPMHPTDFYFVTTNAFNSPSRLWRMRFSNINDLSQGGTITALLDGTEGQQMLDNMTIDKWGRIFLQEDVGGNARLGKTWMYTIATDALIEIASHDTTRFLAGGANFLTQDEEASGVIDAQDILGAGMFLQVDQAHYGIAGELVEGGQLLAMYVPNAEIKLQGNGVSIVDGDATPSATDNTNFGNVNPGESTVKTFAVQNLGSTNLSITGISFSGANAGDFSLVDATFPITVVPGGAQTITVKFAAGAQGIRNATLVIASNDYDEASYDVALQGQGVCAPYTTTIAVSPSPTVDGQLANTIYLGYGAQSVTLSSSVPQGFAPYTYSWSPITATTGSVLVSPTATTNYTVSVANAYGCTSTANQTVAVIDIRDGDKNKVFVCHNGHTQSISIDAVPAHLKIGDKLGRCDDEAVANSIGNISLYPNPTQNQTTVSFELEKDEQVLISIVDKSGNVMWKQGSKNLKAGKQTVSLNTSSLMNGTYFVQLSSASGVSQVKMIIVR